MKQPRLTVLLLVSTILGGCAANVNVKYAPDPAHKSPLETLKPLTVSLVAEDMRDTTERDRVGDRKNAYGSTFAPVLTSQTPTMLIQEALQKEFTNNGIQIVEATSSVPHKAIIAKLKKYWVENKMNFFDISMHSTISADVVIDTVPSRSQISTHTITGTAQDSRQIALESAYEDTLSEATKEFIHNFSRDPGVLSALRGSP